MEEVRDFSPVEAEKLEGIISMLSVGDVKCDRCGKVIRHLERYCVNTKECYHCNIVFNQIGDLNTHFIEKHAPEPARGTRFCQECSKNLGYLRTVRNKKTGETFPAMLLLRDEDYVEPEKPEKKGKQA